MTQETDQDQRRRISEMERDVLDVENLRGQWAPSSFGLNRTDVSKAAYDEASIRLTNAETQIEDLKLQLDDALGAEDMLVQLTERNLMLGEVRISHSSCELGFAKHVLYRKLRRCG